MRKHLDMLLTLIVMLILTVALLWPIDTPPAPAWIDKLVHLAAFAAVAFPLARTNRVSLLIVLIGACAFGGLIELMQPTFNRSADLDDWIADILGAMLGLALGSIYRRVREH